VVGGVLTPHVTCHSSPVTRQCMADQTEPIPVQSGASGVTRPKASLRLQLARLGMLLFVVAITVFVYAIRDRTEELERYGYVGVFVLSLLASATVILPAPGLLFVFGASALGLSPLLVGLAAGAGATLGELSGYLAGFSGQAIIENRDMYARLTTWMEKYGAETIFVLAFIPIPLMDLAGIAAGALRMSLPRFLFWCFLGKVLKMLVVAYAGAYSVEWVARFLQ